MTYPKIRKNKVQIQVHTPLLSTWSMDTLNLHTETISLFYEAIFMFFSLDQYVGPNDKGSSYVGSGRSFEII